MVDKDKVLECFKDKYECLESQADDACNMYTFGNPEEPLALNIQLFNDSIIVSIIDKDEKKVVDKYDDTIESDDDAIVKVTEALTNFDNIKEIKLPEIMESRKAIKESAENGVDDFKEQRDEGVFALNEIKYECQHYVENFSDNEFWYKDENMDELRRVFIDIQRFVNQGIERAFGVKDISALINQSKSVEESVETPEIQSTSESNVVEDLEAIANRLQADSKLIDTEITSKIVDSISTQIKSACVELKDIYPLENDVE